MLKRKAKRIGKKAFKFKFTVVVHNADIHHTEKWKRTNVIVQWARHGRNVVTQNCTHLEEPSAVKSRAIWEEPLSMLATLYRNPKDNSLEEKAYSFKIYESKGKKMGKCLASTSVNLSEYASVDGQNNKMTLELSSQMDAVDRALLRVTISCEAVANSDDNPSEFDDMSDASSIHYVTEDAEALEESEEEEAPPPTSGNYVLPTQAHIAHSIDKSDSLPVLAQFTKGGRDPTERAKEASRSPAPTASAAPPSSAPAKAAKATGVPRTRFHDVNLHQLNEDELRDLVIDFRKHYDKEFRRFDDSQRALTGDLIAAKMQAAQLDYDNNQLRLEKAKLQKNVALLKLRLLEDQRKLTKLEASLAKAAS